jgi:hypothetical protein
MADGTNPILPAVGASPALPRRPNILLVGDPGRAFVDADGVCHYPCEVAASLLDGMDLAARGDFALVGVVMDGTAGHLYAALRALRKETRARIILLAQMHEEPIARRLVEEGLEGGKLADEYIVCPTFLTRLCDLTASESTEAGTSAEGQATTRPSATLVHVPPRMT